MAKVDFFVDIDLNKSQLKNAITHRVTTAERTALAGTLVVADGGLGVFDTDLNKFFGWDGTAFVDLSQTIQNALTIKGEIDASTNPSYPATPAVGDVWTITTAGTVGGEIVEIGDQLVYSSSGWFIVQANLSQATETIEGKIRIATQAEVNAGSAVVAAVTPDKMMTYLNTIRPKKYAVTIATLPSNTPTVITHNLALGNKDDYVIGVSLNGNGIQLAHSGTTVNTLTIESNKTLTNVRVVVIGL